MVVSTSLSSMSLRLGHLAVSRACGDEEYYKATDQGFNSLMSQIVNPGIGISPFPFLCIGLFLSFCLVCLCLVKRNP